MRQRVSQPNLVPEHRATFLSASLHTKHTCNQAG